MVTTYTDATIAWALALANNPQAPLSKEERQRFREVALVHGIVDPVLRAKKIRDYRKALRTGASK
jgi:hypothetical protein